MLNPDISSKLGDRAVQQAIKFWVQQVVAMMGQVKSERFIRLWLRKKLKGTSETGITYIYRLAQVEFEFLKRNGTHQPN